MSNGYAIAAVTAVLRRRIDEGLSADKVGDIVGSITVSALPPDRIVKANQADPIQVNLFLHQVTLNAGWRNVELPSRNSDGEVVRAPPVAVNLHYLVTAYGPQPYVPEILLGHTVRILAQSATLEREAIRQALTPAAPDPVLSALLASNLAEQVELIKVTPEAVNTEEMSRLWSAFQTHYRPTLAYQASVVLIEGRGRARPALPIRRRGVYGDTLASPEILAIEAADGAQEPITTESLVVIRGRRLLSPDGVQASFGSTVLTPAEVTATTIGVDLKTAPRPLAGVTGVSVTHPLNLGQPAVPHDGYVSNTVAAIIRPVVTATSRNNASTETIDGVDYATGQFSVTAGRPIGRDQKVEILLNEIVDPPTRPPRGYVLAVPPGNGVVDPAVEIATVAAPYVRLARGDYLVRLRVDGADSLLDVDGDGRFSTPRRTV
ncbi:DUF4255 domain-containing protein [Caulobacter endophyticus]|uniref:DUF4255 domain-containing protein n=1 Tax=Caulobacter endophyticus TaxID=2172652 RepID=UPI002410559A|nr:DUF4255 domain-containing protein [Caulobacter endophyticus]MDG2527880.1 DUF4255 domain-containing protein [Caulobacter endophyticus]